MGRKTKEMWADESRLGISENFERTTVGNLPGATIPMSQGGAQTFMATDPAFC